MGVSDAMLLAFNAIVCAVVYHESLNDHIVDDLWCLKQKKVSDQACIVWRKLCLFQRYALLTITQMIVIVVQEISKSFTLQCEGANEFVAFWYNLLVRLTWDYRSYLSFLYAFVEADPFALRTQGCIQIVRTSFLPLV